MKQERLQIFADEVHLWQVLTEARHFGESMLNTLSQSEKARAERFLAPLAKMEFILGRVALREILSRYLGVAPENLELELTKHGKPVLKNAPLPLTFSLTHSGGQVFIAVALSKEIGIDFETRNEKRAFSSIAQEVFSPLEISELERLNKNDYVSRFYDLWTLKEAYTKARGLGLKLPFSCINILFSNRSFSIAAEFETRFFSPIEDRAEHWHMQIIRPATGGVLALSASKMATESVKTSKVFQLHLAEPA